MYKRVSALICLFIIFSGFTNIQSKPNNRIPAKLKFVNNLDANVYTERFVYELFNRMGVDVSVTLMGTDSGIESVDAGIYDGICNQSRTVGELYPNLIEIPLNESTANFCAVTLSGSSESYSSWNDFENKTVGSLTGKLVVKENLPKTIKSHVESSSLSVLFDSLRSGECDVVIITDTSGRKPEKLFFPSDLKMAGLIYSEPCSVFLNNKFEPLAGEIEKTLLEMENDGSIDLLRRMKPLKKRKNKVVLYISSYSSEMAWEQDIFKGIGNIINPYKNITFHNISLNSFRNTDITLRENAALTAITVSFIHSPPDAVIVSDNEAMQFIWSNYNNILPKNIPIIFCGINNSELVASQKFEKDINLYGVVESISARQTMEEILKMFPETRNLFVINDFTLTGERWKTEIEAQLGSVYSGINISYSDNLPFDSIKENISQFGDNTVILLGSYFLDSEGIYYSQQEVQNEISKISNVPVFGLLGNSQGYGQIGGRYTNGVVQGEEAARILLDLQENEEVEEGNYYIEREEYNDWIFDYSVMDKFGLSGYVLPDNAVVLNKPLSLRESNPILYITILIVAITVSIIIILLCIFVYMLKKRNKQINLTNSRLQESRDKLANQKEALNQAYHDLENIIETSPIAICLICPDENRFVFVNPSWKKLFQFPDTEQPGELKNGDDWIFHPHSPDELIDKAVKTDRVVSCEWQFKSYEGELFDVMVYLKRIIYDGKTCLVMNHKDLRKEKARESMLKNAAEKERDANRLKSHFLMNMSHEIRTPMNAIIGITQLAKESDDSSRLFQSILKIGRSASVLLNIITNVLDLSLIKDGKVTLQPHDAELSRILQEVESVVSVEANKKNLTEIINTDDVINDKIFVDSARLQQVLLAVYSNAVKFTPEGGTIILTVKETQNKPNISTFTFSISDTGIGIEPEKMNRLFKPFEQADDSITRKHGGAGLGLSVSKGIIDMMGGQMMVESEPGKGSTFSFTIDLPVKPSSTPEKPSDDPHVGTPENNPNEETDIDFTALRILVVDDVDMNRIIATELLNELGVKTEEAQNGREAVNMINSSSPGYYSLVFMDVQMPVLDGCSAVKELRSSRREDLRTMPIVAMTANVMPDDIEMITKSGMNGYIGKPVFLERIIEVIKEYNLGTSDK